MSEELRLSESAIKTLSKKSTITLIAGKARLLSAEDPDFVRADIGELCIPGLFPPGYKEGLEKTASTALNEGRIGYTVPDGDNRLKKLIFKHELPDLLQGMVLEQLRDEAIAQNVDFEKYREESIHKYVAVTHGGTGALGAAVSMFLTEDKKIIVTNQRTWQNHNLIVDMHGGMIWPVPLIDEEGKVAEPEQILKLCQPVKGKIAAFLYTLINNPDGAVITNPAEQYKLETIINELGVPLILDVAYHRMVFEGRDAQSFSPEVMRKTVVCGTFSKTLQIPGERLGYISSFDPRAARFVYFYNRSHSGCPSVSPQRALISHFALYEKEPHKISSYHQKLMIEIKKRRDLLVEKVRKELGWEIKPPGGAIYAVIHVPQELIKRFGDIDQFALQLVEKGRVSTISGTVFEFRVRKKNSGIEVYNPEPTHPDVAYIRFCYGFTPPERIELAIEHIKNFISS